MVAVVVNNVASVNIHIELLKQDTAISVQDCQEDPCFCATGFGKGGWVGGLCELCE
jgi:hypothetical protein